MAVQSLNPRSQDDVLRMPSTNLTSNADHLTRFMVNQGEECAIDPLHLQEAVKMVYASYLLNSMSRIPVSDFSFYCHKFGFPEKTRPRVLNPTVSPMTK